MHANLITQITASNSLALIGSVIAAQHTSPKSGIMKEVVIVDDDEDIRGFIEVLLIRKGFKCIGYSDFNIHELQTIPDAFVLDYLLSGKNGVDVCLAIREKKELQTVPIIMISALSDVKQKCLEAGATAFLGKPFNVADLLESLHKALAPHA